MLPKTLAFYDRSQRIYLFPDTWKIELESCGLFFKLSLSILEICAFTQNAMMHFRLLFISRSENKMKVCFDYRVFNIKTFMSSLADVWPQNAVINLMEKLTITHFSNWREKACPHSSSWKNLFEDREERNLNWIMEKIKTNTRHSDFYNWLVFGPGKLDK